MIHAQVASSSRDAASAALATAAAAASAAPVSTLGGLELERLAARQQNARNAQRLSAAMAFRRSLGEAHAQREDDAPPVGTPI